MELKITTRMAPDTLPELEWNHEELKQEIALKAAEYQSIAYTDEQTAEMKKDRATLNKLVTAFEDQRKQVKKFYMAPYDKFDAQVKEVLSPVRDAIKTIDAGIAEVDRQYRVNKSNLMRSIYDANVGDLKMIVPFEKTVLESNFNKSVTDKKLEKYYADLFTQIRSDIDTLDKLPERFRDKAIMKYMETFSLSDAIREEQRLEAIEKANEERRKAVEAEREAAEKAAAEKAAQKPEPPKQADEAAQANENAGATQKAENAASAAPEGTPEDNPVFYIDFRAWGTKEQLIALRKFMVDNGIRFGKVE